MLKSVTFQNRFEIFSWAWKMVSSKWVKFQILGEVSLLYVRPGFSFEFSLRFAVILKAHVLNLYSNIGHLKRHIFLHLFWWPLKDVQPLTHAHWLRCSLQMDVPSRWASPLGPRSAELAGALAGRLRAGFPAGRVVSAFSHRWRREVDMLPQTGQHMCCNKSQVVSTGSALLNVKYFINLMGRQQPSQRH